MKKIGMIFPGQGSQYLGMGKELHDKQRIVQECFQSASSCLDINFVRLCFASSERELRETVNAQTSIFLLSTSIYLLLKKRFGITPDIVAGHSSGEYAALVAAGGISFPDALYLLKKRAEFMHQATVDYSGGMIAVVGLDFETLDAICKKYDQLETKTAVAQIVNYNSSKQLVVSGTFKELESVSRDVREKTSGRVIPLNVAGAFHSRLMRGACEQFGLYMVKVDIKDLRIPLVANIDAGVISNKEEVERALKKQMRSPVQWWPSMQHLSDCDVIIQVGPGDAYAKMLKREWPDKEIIAINSKDDIKALLPLLGKAIERTCYEENCDPELCAAKDEIINTNLFDDDDFSDYKTACSDKDSAPLP